MTSGRCPPRRPAPSECHSKIPPCHTLLLGKVYWFPFPRSPWQAEGSSLLKSLSYVPARFDEGTTIDVERSQPRYSKIVVHTRARTQRSKAWEQWLQGATLGREVTLLEGFDLKELSDDPPPASPEARSSLGCERKNRCVHNEIRSTLEQSETQTDKRHVHGHSHTHPERQFS